MQNFFAKFAARTAHLAGSSWAFILAALGVVIWAVSGPVFHFSDTWELIINTATTIITFLMVFLIQNAQNRDSKAIHLKLDELLRAVHEARTTLIDIEDDSDEDLQQLQREFEQVRNQVPANQKAQGQP